MIGRSEVRRAQAARMLEEAQRSAPAGWHISDAAQVLCGERVVIFGHAKDDQGACSECVTRWQGR